MNTLYNYVSALLHVLAILMIVVVLGAVVWLKWEEKNCKNPYYRLTGRTTCLGAAEEFGANIMCEPETEFICEDP